MAASQAAAPPSVQRTASRQAGLGMGVNLYVTLPSAGRRGHGSFFGNGPLLALHAALGMFLILSAITVLGMSIRIRNATLMATSAAGLMATLLAAAAALACYAVGLYAASTARSWSS